MLDQIRSFELELTTRCNARCPQCVRNDFGGPVYHALPLVDIDLMFLQRKIQPVISHIKTTRLCGTYGDPCIHPGAIDMVKWLVDNSESEIFINTNGGLRQADWWQDLAQALGRRGKVFFGIDGLEDTNHLYRVDVNWSRLMTNLEAFNQAGGHSVWIFLVFEHNQHQVKQAETLAKTLGCESFMVKSTGRFLNKRHEIMDRSPVKDRNGTVVRWLRPTTEPQYINPGYSQGINAGGLDIQCHSLHNQDLVITAEGYVLPCGWLYDRFYGVETEGSSDQIRLFEMIRSSGGLERISLHHHDLQEILAAEFFRTLQNSWQDGGALDRCTIQCGRFRSLYTHSHIRHAFARE